jgi:putative ABC transport system permease protein
MSTAVLDRPATPSPRPHNGGVPARRAVARWAWRLLRREWRQQLLVLALIVFAVAATFVGATVAADTPPPANAGFGTAHDAATFAGAGAQVTAQIASLERRFGRVDVIADETLTVPGSVTTYALRAQDPHGAFGSPMLALDSGRFPVGGAEVAVTPGMASEFDLRVGSTFTVGGASRRVVGIVENPQSLLDEFALVAPGQVTAPTQVTVLFDAPGVKASSIGPTVTTPGSATPTNVINPETISLAVVTIGMLLIALVAIGGFTVLAQRRLRSLGMLASLGATERHIRAVVQVNGLLVGIAGAVVGSVAGFLVWLAYRPHLEQSSHHRIGALAVPWLVVGVAVALAVVATSFASSRPARAIARVPIVTALSGRPAPPRKLHRSALPGIVMLVIAFLLLGYAGGIKPGGSDNAGIPELVFGLAALIPAVILLAPFCLSAMARAGRRAPVAVRLALRDLDRYRARAGSALGAISIGVLIAVIIAIVAAARYGNALDYAGPNLAANQLWLSPNQADGPSGNPTAREFEAGTSTATRIAAAVGAQVIELQNGNVSVQHAGRGRSWNGPIYVATPALLHAFGITASQIDPGAVLLTSRPGLSGVSGLSLTWCNVASAPRSVGRGPGGGQIFTQQCQSGGSLAHPTIEELGALPSGTSAPNTVITEQALRRYGIAVGGSSWLLQSAQPFTAAQIHEARATAATANLYVESKNHQPTSAAVIDWATVFGIVLALCILAMSVGLIRSETAADLRTLSATGASSRARRTLTAATAGALGFAGALLGIVAGYVAVLGYLRNNALNGGIGALASVPVANLLVILVGMPLAAAAVGWLLGGRDQPAMAHQPIE